MMMATGALAPMLCPPAGRAGSIGARASAATRQRTDTQRQFQDPRFAIIIPTMATTRQLARDPEVLRLMQEVESLRLELEAMAQRLAEAERLADHDVLTPLLNRRAFVRELQRAIALTRRHETPASVIYFDLDDFKGVNDRHGHAAGDAVLIAVAVRLQAH